VTSTGACIQFLLKDIMDQFFEHKLQHTLIHGNLSSHRAPEVTEVVYKHGHCAKFQVPYQPHEAPIELTFDQRSCEVHRRWGFIFNESDLIANVQDIIETRVSLGGFDDLCHRCGYL
jgi:hypothetical protein